MIYYEPEFFSEQVGMQFLRLWFFSFRDGLHWFSSRFGELGSAWPLLWVRNFCSATLTLGLSLYTADCFLKVFVLSEARLPLGAALMWLPVFFFLGSQKKRMDRAVLEVVKNPSLGFGRAVSLADLGVLKGGEMDGISRPLGKLFVFFGGKEQTVLQKMQAPWTELQERFSKQDGKRRFWGLVVALQVFLLSGGFQAGAPALQSAVAALIASLVLATFRLVYRGGGEWYLRRMVFQGAQNPNPEAFESSIRDFHAFYRVQQWPVASILREDWLIGLGFFLWWLPLALVLGLFFPGFSRLAALVGCFLLPFFQFFIRDSRLFHSLRAVSGKMSLDVPFFIFGWIGWGCLGLFGLELCSQLAGSGFVGVSQTLMTGLKIRHWGFLPLFLICSGLFWIPGIYESLGRGRKLGVRLLVLILGFLWATSALQLIWLAPLIPVLELTAAVLGFRMKEKG